MPSSVSASVDVIEFQTAERYSRLNVTRVKYNMHIHSRDAKVQIVVVVVVVGGGGAVLSP
jgi:hypothetical protein